jgi:hypothetical protein
MRSRKVTIAPGSQQEFLALKKQLAAEYEQPFKKLSLI